MLKSKYEPINDAKIAGPPNFIKISLSIFLDTMKSLKILFEKWIIPVNAIAISTGKKIIIVGVKIVPSPKPEKNVRTAAEKVTSVMITTSNVIL